MTDRPPPPAPPPAPPADDEAGALRREVAYLRRLAESTAARTLSLDLQSIEMRHELEQKRHGFRLMAELAVTLGGDDTDYADAFTSVARRLNATLNMQRTAVLVPDDAEGHFRPAVLQGYPPDRREAVAECRPRIDPALLDPLHPALVTGADPAERLGALRKALALPYLITAPVILNGEVAALLVTGRVQEERPYLPRLGTSDVESVQTVAAYLRAMLAGHRLRQVESLAKHDPLTKLPNRRGTLEHLGHTLALARRGRFFAAAMFVDLDGFKAVNDTYGHAAGDLVLTEIAGRLADTVRGSDFVGRIGGDEFLVVLSHVKRPKDAGLVAGKIIEQVSAPIESRGERFHVGASVGIAIFPDHGTDVETLVKAADEAMYAVKGQGKNGYAFTHAAVRHCEPQPRRPTGG